MKSLLPAVAVLLSTISFAQPPVPKFDVQGHRGARGLMPENSIPGFIAALDSGVTTLELDLAVTRDRQIIVSHEPWMAANICLDNQGNAFPEKEEMQFNIFGMTYEEVKQFDCGSKGNKDFPGQQKMKVHKPLLTDVIVAAEEHVKSYTRYEVDYNIEIKTDPRGDGTFHPRPEEFSDLVYSLLDQYLPLDRIIIQSFDFRVLKYWHEKYPQVRLSAVVDNDKTEDENLTELGFIPSIYSPQFRMLSAEAVRYLHGKVVSSKNKKATKLRVVPWTVNEEKDMLVLKGMGVDGFITDYPNRAAKFKQTLSIKANGKK